MWKRPLAKPRLGFPHCWIALSPQAGRGTPHALRAPFEKRSASGALLPAAELKSFSEHFREMRLVVSDIGHTGRPADGSFREIREIRRGMRVDGQIHAHCGEYRGVEADGRKMATVRGSV